MPVNANPITFTPNGDNNAGNIKCEVPVNALGGMLLKSGTANISGKVISIKAGSAYIDTPRTVLVGSVLRTEANLSSSPPTVTGLALFLMGDWADQIDDQATQDTIFRKEGHIEGRILGIENDSLSVKLQNGQQTRVPLASVLYIRSPRVYVFKIALKSKQALQKDAEFQADSTEASFRPTSTARTLSGSIIPQSEKKTDDGMGMMSPIGVGGMSGGGVNGLGGLPTGPSGLGGNNVVGGMGALGGMNQMGGMGNSGMNNSRLKTAVPNQNDNSFDDAEDSARFSTIKTKWGTQKLTLPPGILE